MFFNFKEKILYKIKKNSLYKLTLNFISNQYEIHLTIFLHFYIGRILKKIKSSTTLFFF